MHYFVIYKNNNILLVYMIYINLLLLLSFFYHLKLPLCIKKKLFNFFVNVL